MKHRRSASFVKLGDELRRVKERDKEGGRRRVKSDQGGLLLSTVDEFSEMLNRLKSMVCDVHLCT